MTLRRQIFGKGRDLMMETRDIDRPWIMADPPPIPPHRQSAGPPRLVKKDHSFRKLSLPNTNEKVKE